MHKNRLILFPLVAATMTIAAQNASEWENPEIIGINKLPYHVTLTLPSHRADCPEIQSLNGRWHFAYANDINECPQGFERDDYDASGWTLINVPCDWQTQGYDRPIYTNIGMPIKCDPPSVTSEPPSYFYAYDHRHPVGSYVTTFNSDGNTADNSYYLKFDGVKSAMYLWLNGKFVGYSQNSMSPAEFDITPYIRRGENRLAVQVHRWSDGSYLEDQDMWRLSGIFRDVELWQRPKAHISDYHVSTNLSEDFKHAEATVTFTVRNTAKSASKPMEILCKIGNKDAKVKVPSIKPGKETKVSTTIDFDNPLLWSADKPNLYPLDITLSLKDNAIENFKNHVGFVKAEIRDNVLTVNGRPVKMRGVNRHEHHPQTGRYVDPETMRRDVELMKQCGINMVRTSHYPDAPYFYELCDIYGIYVMDEANNESHALNIGNTTLGDNPRWRDAIVDRGVSLVSRDINHPSVIIWSMGNESMAGDNVEAMRRAMEEIDNSRIIFYDSDVRVSDIYDDSYPPPARIERLARTVNEKPLIMREYGHAMGNSLGNLKEYWDIIYAYPNFVGAAIWDWVDQGFKIQHPDLKISSEDFAYGGDFGDQPNDGAFNLNGMISPDRIPHPHYYEVKYTYQPIYFSLGDNGTIKLDNKQPFTGLDEYRYTYEIVADGDVVSTGECQLKGDRLQLPPLEIPEGEIFINVYAKLREQPTWAPDGYIDAYDQFFIGEGSTSSAKSSAKSHVDNTGADITVTSGADTFTFSADGKISSWTRDGQQVLSAPLEPYFWKPANNNEMANGYRERCAAWRNPFEGARLLDHKVVETDSSTTVTYLYRLKAGVDMQVSYTTVDGGIQATIDFRPFLSWAPTMPKFGMRMGIPADMKQVSWYGRGPHENYPDRKNSALIGRYSMDIEEFITDYIQPQDNANRCDVRECTFTGPTGTLTARFDVPGNFRAWPYTEDALEAARHPSEIKKCGYINVNLDHQIQGVGGINTFGAQCLDDYLVESHHNLQQTVTITLK